MKRLILFLLMSSALCASQWEYSALYVFDNGSIVFKTKDEVIKTQVVKPGDKLSTYQAAYGALAKKLGGKDTDTDKQLYLLNLLGKEGWELVNLTKHGLSEEYVFKLRVK